MLADTFITYVSNKIHTCSEIMRFPLFQVLSKSLESASGKLFPVKCDVSNESDVLAAFKWVKDNLGGVDILINNAAAATDTSLTGKPKEIPPKCSNFGESHPANYTGCVAAKELQALRNKVVNQTKLSPSKDTQASTTRNERLTTHLATAETKTYAAAVKAQPPRTQIQPTNDTSTNVAKPPLHTADMTITQHLQLIIAKLDNHEKMHIALCERLDRLEKASPPRGS